MAPDWGELRALICAHEVEITDALRPVGVAWRCDGSMLIDDGNLSEVIDLLVAGFPTRKRAFWERGIARLHALPMHRDRGAPLGYAMKADGRIVGAGLTAVTRRPPLCSVPSADAASRCCSQAPTTCINLASWYVEPGQRWRMPVLLRNMMTDASAIYTDLTPTTSVQPILTALGFHAINNGVKVVATPAAALQRRGDATVRAWDGVVQSGTVETGPPCRRGNATGSATCTACAADESTTCVPDTADALSELLRDHVALGCLAFEIRDAHRCAHVVLKPTTIKGVRSVQLVFATDTAFTSAAIGPLSRALIARGYLALIMDIQPGVAEASAATQIALPQRRRRFIKNAVAGRGTDYAYSELVLFDL